jgi:hypothetical protein
MEKSLVDTREDVGICSSRNNHPPPKNSFHHRVRIRAFSRRGDKSRTSSSSSSSKLSKLRIFQDDSHGTADLDISRPFSSAGVEGCLKIRTQAGSLVHPYRSVVATNTTDAQKSVRFGDLEIHNHEIILGDNPAISRGGPPIAIGWRVLRTDRISVNDYERFRPARRPLRHCSMARAERERLLMEFGYARSDLKAREQEIRAIQKSRMDNAKSGRAIDSIVACCIRRRSHLENAQVD